MLKDTENINPRVSNTSNGRTMMLSKCSVWGSSKLKFIKNQDAKGLWSNLGVRTPLSKVPILGNILFWTQIQLKCMLGDKYMSEMHLKQLGFTYSACGPFTKNKKRIQKFKETSDTSYIYKNELDKACF